jgi:hypothetical protein
VTTQTSSRGQHDVGEAWRPPLVSTVATLPTRVKLAGGLAAAIAGLLVAGVPLTTFVPFAGLAACLGMHLFMGHGHGDHHADEHPPESTGVGQHHVEASSVELAGFSTNRPGPCA